MRVLFDTNVFISYLLARGKERTVTAVVQAAIDGAFRSLLPLQVDAELTGSIARKRYLAERIPSREATELMALLEEIAEVVFQDLSEIPAVCRYVKDDYLLALAVLGEADYLVTGDKDLLVLREVEGVKIVTPTEFLGMLPGGS